MQRQIRRKKKNMLPSKTRLNRRVFRIGIAMCMSFVVMGYEVAKISLIKGEEYAKGALANMNQSEREIEAPRGLIQDRKGRPMATSLLSYNVILSPYEMINHVDDEKRTNIYEVLAKYVPDRTVEGIKKIVEGRPNSKYFELAKKLSLTDEAVDAMKVLGGVTVQKTYIRSYPSEELAAQVLGFYNGDEGQYGIEQGYNVQLVGQAGREYSQIQQGDIITREYQEPKAGNTVTLTLDKTIQQYVSEVMEKYIKEHNPTDASAIIMDPNTGEILAMYSYPSFNPNKYNDLSSELGKNVWANLKNEAKTTALLSAWKNYGIQFNYEPGSTFKPLVAAMALEENAISESITFNCTGSKRVADRTIPCWHTAGHGVQTLSQALANSCNVAMAEIAEKLDSETFIEYFKRYGFGEKTGIELAGEEKGILHTTYGPVDKATSSIGQTFMVTPIQLITAFSSVINGGYLMEPYIVSDVTSQSGENVLSHGKVTRRQVLSSNVADLIREDLKKVVDEGGTGTTASIPGYSIGGKTGTGQKFIEGTNKRVEGLYVASFMGFAPVEDPKVVALIVFDNLPEHTGVPTKAFKDMMENIFPYLDIQKNNGTTESDEQTVEVPSVANKTIYEAINVLTQQGFKYEILGSGSNVKEQYPEAKSSWGKGGTIRLYAQTDNAAALVEVPNLIGKTVAEATELVKGKFTLSANGSGTISSQVPAAGYKIEKNNKIIVQTN